MSILWLQTRVTLTLSFTEEKEIKVILSVPKLNTIGARLV